MEKDVIGEERRPREAVAKGGGSDHQDYKQKINENTVLENSFRNLQKLKTSKPS